MLLGTSYNILNENKKFNKLKYPVDVRYSLYSYVLLTKLETLLIQPEAPFWYTHKLDK